MSTIANDLGSFARDIQSIQTACSVLRTKYEMLRSDFDGLQSMWEGEAHATIAKRFNVDYATLGTLVDYIDNLASSLSEAQEGYEHCERDVSNIIVNIAV